VDLGRLERHPRATNFVHECALAPRAAKVAQFHLAHVLREHQHVLQLDVAVRQLLRVDEIEGRGELTGDPLAGVLAETAGLHIAGEVAVRRVLLREHEALLRAECHCIRTEYIGMRAQVIRIVKLSEEILLRCQLLMDRLQDYPRLRGPVRRQ